MASGNHPHDRSFPETGLPQHDTSDQEVDRADLAGDERNKHFPPQYQSAASPVHRAVWERRVPIELFATASQAAAPAAAEAMERSLQLVRQARHAQSLYGPDGIIRQRLIDQLGDAGYWGLLVDQRYGGSEASFQSFVKFLTQIAAVCPAVAGLGSIHGCIGAVDPIQTFGTEQQKQRFLPRLANGQPLSAFALTEPQAGSDVTALRTTAVRKNDHYLVNGEKVFISNADVGRTLALVCMIDREPAVLIVELPKTEDEHFFMRRYGQYALKHTPNCGLVFRDFRVPVDHRLYAAGGNGLTIAYHGLNRGRVAVCAQAAGNMRRMLVNLAAWVNQRVTYGRPLAQRELIQRRIGRLASWTVACDALVQWCGGLLQQGYRCELECIVAKVFGSEAQKEASIDLFMKTCGGRSFLHGHPLGDNLYQYLAPCIYEGEGDLLQLAFFKSLVKQHHQQFFAPRTAAAQTGERGQYDVSDPPHRKMVAATAVPYAKWWLSHRVRRGAVFPSLSTLLREPARWSVDQLQNVKSSVSRLLRRYQRQVADRQCEVCEATGRVMAPVVVLTTCLYAAQRDRATQQAASVLYRDLQSKHFGRRLKPQDFRAAAELGRAVLDGDFPPIFDVDPDDTQCL